MKPVLVCDFDDVIVPTLNYAVRLCNRENGTNFKVEDFKEWDVSKVYKDFTKYFYQIDFTKIQDKLNAVYYLEKLSHTFEIIIAMASHVDKFKEKEIWIKKNMPFVKHENIMLVKNKSVLRGDIFIDDSIHNFGGEFKLKLLYNTPANANFEVKGSVRISDLSEVADCWAERI